MAKQLITIGTPGAGGGDPAHAAFKKINDNTNEVYSFLGADGSGVLIAEGAREALGVYSKDEASTLVEDTIENANLASLGINEFTGVQRMLAGASVVGEFKVNGSGILGINQNYVLVGNQRALGVTYTNTTGKPILVIIQATSVNTLFIEVDGVVVDSTSGAWTRMTAFVPNGSEYKIWSEVNTAAYNSWVELL